MRRNTFLSGLVGLFLAADCGWTQPPEAPAVTLPPAAEVPLTDFEPAASPPSRFWFQSDYLLWWVKDQPVPATLVLGPFENLTLAELLNGGIYQRPISIGGDQGEEARHGARFSAGAWLDANQTWGIEGSYFFLSERSLTRSAAAPAGSVLASPLSITLAVPGTTIPGVGLFVVGGPNAPSQAALDISSSLQGAELNGVVTLLRGSAVRLSLLGGFRWFELEETLQFTAASNQAAFVGAGQTAGGNGTFSVVATNTSGNLLTLSDRFATSNTFNGGQIGTRVDVSAGRWAFSATGKVAVGEMRQVIEIAGANTVFGGFVPALAEGGIYAQPPNLGRHSQSVTAVVPEVSVNAGYQVTEALRASVGYSLLYVNKVVRPGDQMQPNLDVTPIFTGQPGVAVPPGKLFQTTDFWAQGLTFSLEFRY